MRFALFEDWNDLHHLGLDIISYNCGLASNKGLIWGLFRIIMNWGLEAFNSSFEGTLDLLEFVESFVGLFLPY